MNFPLSIVSNRDLGKLSWVGLERKMAWMSDVNENFDKQKVVAFLQQVGGFSLAEQSSLPFTKSPSALRRLFT